MVRKISPVNDIIPTSFMLNSNAICKQEVNQNANGNYYKVENSGNTTHPNPYEGFQIDFTAYEALVNDTKNNILQKLKEFRNISASDDSGKPTQLQCKLIIQSDRTGNCKGANCLIDTGCRFSVCNTKMFDSLIKTGYSCYKDKNPIQPISATGETMKLEDFIVMRFKVWPSNRIFRYRLFRANIPIYDCLLGSDWSSDCKIMTCNENNIISWRLRNPKLKPEAVICTLPQVYQYLESKNIQNSITDKRNNVQSESRDGPQVQQRQTITMLSRSNVDDLNEPYFHSTKEAKFYMAAVQEANQYPRISKS